jgi:hypothetical protein
MQRGDAPGPRCGGFLQIVERRRLARGEPRRGRLTKQEDGTYAQVRWAGGVRQPHYR